LPLDQGNSDASPQSNLKKNRTVHNHGSSSLGESKRQGIDPLTASFLASATYNAHLFTSSAKLDGGQSTSVEDLSVDQHQRRANPRISGGISSSGSSSAWKGKPTTSGNSSSEGGGREQRSHRGDGRRKKRPPSTAHSVTRRGTLPVSGDARTKPKGRSSPDTQELPPRGRRHSYMTALPSAGVISRDGLSTVTSLSDFDLER